MIALLLGCALSASAIDMKIDLNQASASELMSLPGIGEKKAAGIIEQRAKRPFRRPTEVMLIRGIGPKLYARIKDRVLVQAPLETPRRTPH